MAGIAGLLTAWGVFLSAALDNDPKTVADLTAAINATVLAFGLLAARDNGVSSEDAGVK